MHDAMSPLEHDVPSRDTELLYTLICEDPRMAPRLHETRRRGRSRTILRAGAKNLTDRQRARIKRPSQCIRRIRRSNSLDSAPSNCAPRTRTGQGTGKGHG